MGKRRRGFPSETRVKRGERGVHRTISPGKTVFKDFLEKLGRRDPCPCGSGKRFQGVLPALGPVLTVSTVTSTGAEGSMLRNCQQPRAMMPGAVCFWSCAADTPRHPE